ncbi:MAG: SIS domain-containing protein [Acidobacteria bacterium]|nr:SIS domain-containing protein [Acidobacteriota bacterium]
MGTGFSVSAYLAAHERVARQCDPAAFEAGINLVRAAFETGRQIITCGNGGSAYAASHYITDWNKMVNLATGRKVRGLSLCDNIGIVTAFANDIAYDEVFAGQLKAILEPGDLVIAVSGSGNSRNVVRAVEYANGAGAVTLAIVGYDGGALKRLARHSVWVPSFDMQLCEDLHLMFGHMVMKALCGSPIEE